MTFILVSSGFKDLESLHEFSTRFPNVANPLDNDLEKIWICHKIHDEIPKFDEINFLPSEDYNRLSKKIKRKIDAAKEFFSLMTEFSPLSIFDKIYSQFNKQLATYIFTKCYLFYNWGINAFEPVFDHFEIHKQIEKCQKMPFKKHRRILRNLCVYPFFGDENAGQEKNREKSVDLFDEPICSTTKNHKSKVSYKTFKKAIDKTERFFDVSRNSNNPYQETFSFKKIMYDMKQRPQWPKNHVLSRNSVEDMIVFIVSIPVATSSIIDGKLLDEHKSWFILRELLNKFLKEHQSIDRNNGYGRILKKHLKSVNSYSGRRLLSIPKSMVSSYVLDILRRVLPLELFGGNHLRKKFFRGLSQVIHGAKGQNFIWYNLLRLIVKNKAEIPWCGELGDNYTQSQIILKLFKFLVIHYVFVILRNNFYVTETGSSGFGLRFYRKSDMERSSVVCLNNLLKNKHIQPLRKRDYERNSIERKWLETGRVEEGDVQEKMKKTISRECEYKQPIAHVRFLPKSDEADELRIITNIRQRRKELGAASKKLEKFFTVRLLWRKKKLFLLKLLLEFLVEKYGFGIRPEPYNPLLEANWKKVGRLKETYGKLFFIKADISDAFGSVKYDILSEILRKTREEHSQSNAVQLKKIIEWKKTKWKIEKTARFSFSNRPRENSVMINRSLFLHHKRKINQTYDLKFLEIIKQVVMMQRVEIKGRVFKLTKGLAQGSAGRFSSQLCELYYSAMDRACFRELINSSDSIMLRAVDDYLFITADLEKAHKFLELVQKGIDGYDIKFNNTKLKSNLIDNIHEVLYLGLVFNFENLSVKPSYSKYKEMGLLSTVNLYDPFGNSHFNKDVFLQKRSLRISYLKLHPIVLNNFHGNLKITRQTIFEACLIQSLRVVTLANYIYSGSVKNDMVVYKVLLKSCSAIKNKVSASILSKDEVAWIFFFAAASVLRRFSGQFKLLLMAVRFKLEKCEKAFVNLGSELLLDFLKNDILEDTYWRNVEFYFKQMANIR